MEYATFASREATFAPPSKRSKIGGWPHATPTGAELARAGFYYKPSAHSNDNTVCYLCSRNLDGWEKDDDPVQEHLKHAEDCGWAQLMSIDNATSYDPSEIQDPTDEPLTEARRMTFAAGWPHESKRGWTCKTEKMIEAGWHFAPTTECEDYVSCVYCKLSLDGWEPKDDPFNEHYSRSPSCPFFAFAGTTAPSKRSKAKKGRASRSSRSSKVSTRLSTQSNVSAQSEVPTIPDLEESIDMDTSAMSVLSTASTATTKGKRKAGTGRTKTAKTKRAKTTKPKRTSPESETEAEEAAELEAVAIAEGLVTRETHEPTEISSQEQRVELVVEQVAEVFNTPSHQHSKETNLSPAQNEDTPRAEAPSQSFGPPQRESPAIPVLADSPVRPSSQISQHGKSPLRRKVKVSTPEPPQSPSQQSDIENAPPSTRPESVRPPLSSPGVELPKWSPVDIELIFQKPAGAPLSENAYSEPLSTPEQQMTVQDWIKHMAGKAEADLRAEGERVVGVFEREGQQALKVLEGIVCV